LRYPFGPILSPTTIPSNLFYILQEASTAVAQSVDDYKQGPEGPYGALQKGSHCINYFFLNEVLPFDFTSAVFGGLAYHPRVHKSPGRGLLSRSHG
jgi:hypothetical protein